MEKVKHHRVATTSQFIHNNERSIEPNLHDIAENLTLTSAGFEALLPLLMQINEDQREETENGEVIVEAKTVDQLRVDLMVRRGIPEDKAQDFIEQYDLSTFFEDTTPLVTAEEEEEESYPEF